MEAVFHPSRSRWHALGLYNRVSSDRPLLDVRLGGPAETDRYESVTAGFGRVERRNVRWSLEGTWETRQDQFRLSLGLVTAF